MKVGRGRGFTLIEMLIILAVLGILLGIAGNSMLSLRKNLTLDRAVQMIVQDLQTCRSKSLGESRICRVKVVGASRYEVAMHNSNESNPEALGDFCSDPDYRTPRRRSFPSGVQFQNASAGNCIAFDTRGFAYFGNTTPGIWTVANDRRSYRVIPSIVGAIKVVR